MSKTTILTGLRTNAEYHLGNYLGAILPMVEIQKAHLDSSRVHMFAPDLHSFTTPVDHSLLYAQTMQNLRVFVAAGMPIGNPNFFLYRQSYISAHSELAQILNNFAYFGELSRMTQFKDKSEIAQQNGTAGLFTYPVLMAADILLYGATYVPVGDDQRQHLELTRDLAMRFNNKFGEIFTLPEPWTKQLKFTGRSEGIRIRSLKHPEKKMSKSVEDPSGTIRLTDTPEEAVKKISGATTDSHGSINWDWETQPGITNLLQILYLLSGTDRDQVVREWSGNSNYGELKAAVADAVAVMLKTVQELVGAIDSSELEAQLSASEAVMRDIANEKLYDVQKAVGLRS